MVDNRVNNLQHSSPCTHFNTLRPRQNGRHFPDDIFKWIFLNENVWISNKISLKFVPKVPINNIPALVQILAWRRSGDKPLSEPMMVSLLMHICVNRPQWVKDACSIRLILDQFWHIMACIWSINHICGLATWVLYGGLILRILVKTKVGL